MGLDIYLKRYDAPLAQVKEEDAAWEKITSALYEKHEAMAKAAGHGEKWTTEESEAWRKEEDAAGVGAGRNADEYNENKNVVRIETNSAMYPDHLFKVGYFRSSYNSGGIDSILGDRINTNLHGILGLIHDEYIQKPKWDIVIANCDAAIANLRKYASENPFSVMEVGFNIFSELSSLPANKSAALELAKKTLMTEADKTFRAFENRDGYWNLDGIKVYGIVPGTFEVMGRGQPTVYAVVKHSKEGEEPFKWYINAIEIIKETAQWVLSQPEPNKYYLHVSG